MAFRRSRLIADRNRRQPSIRHEREPNTPLPIEGCHCDACEDAREDLHGAHVGQMLGLSNDTEPERSR